MKNDEIERRIIEFISTLSDDYEEPIKYDKRSFISFIIAEGKSMYDWGVVNVDSDDMLEAVSEKLTEKFGGYFLVRLENHCIVIATPVFIRSARETIGRALGIIPDAFIEVSGPKSTVLVIDCEKQYLRKTYLGIGEEEWLF